MSNQILTELPNIQYAGMDYQSVMAELQNIIRDNPNWSENWSEFYSSEAGTMFLQLMSWITDNMSTRQDVLYNEMFLTTAQKDENKIKLLKQIGYNPIMAHAAKAPVVVEFNTVPTSDVYITPERNSPLHNRINDIMKVSGKDINGQSCQWEILKLSDGKPDYLRSVILPSGVIESKYDKENNNIYAIQGETKYLELTAESSDGAYINIPDLNVAADSIRVFIKSTIKECKQVTSFISKEALSEEYGIPYVVEYNTDKTYNIRFPKKDMIKKSRLLPAGATVSIFYRTTNGDLGNIPLNFINTEATLKDKAGNNYSVKIRNYNLGTDGTAAESLESAVMNGPLSIRTMERAVTPEDYNIILNRNPNIFKSKTYTSSNQPDNWKNYYGRWINPQESFSFVMLNKNWKNVPTSKYNYFPWVTLIKEPRINEKYVFDSATYNYSANLGETYYNYHVVNKNANTDVYRNATVITLSDLFNNSLFTSDGQENKNLKLKLTTEETQEPFFSNIPFDLIYPKDSAEGKKAYISMDNYYLSYDDNARFISKNSFNISTPIDISSGQYINVYLDNKTELEIDLWVEKDENFEGPFYVLWSNQGVIDPKANYGSNATKEAANLRNGIVELINKQIAALMVDGGVDYDLYNEHCSFQYFGLNLSANDSVITSLNQLNHNVILNVNDKTYAFTLSGLTLSEAQSALYGYVNDSYVWNSGLGLKDLLNYTFLHSGCNLRIVENGVFKQVTGNPLANYKADIVEVLHHDTDVENSDNRRSVYNSYDLIIKTTDASELTNYSYVDNLNITHKLKNVINISDPIGVIEDNSTHTEYKGFIHSILGDHDYNTNTKNMLPEPLQAAKYENLASILMTDKSNGVGYFCLKSPITGSSSSIFFKKEDYGTDFMNNILGIYFNNSGYSYKAYGVKKIKLQKNNALRTYVVDNSNETTLGDLFSGSLVFENSCIYNNYDFQNVFGQFKLASSDVLKLGSVYENFYYNGDDEELKEDIVGIEGQYINCITLDDGTKVYSLDEYKSDLNIKFTLNQQDTNSIYKIESDIDIIPCKEITLSSYDIANYPLNNSHTLFQFSIDNMTENESFKVDLYGSKNGKEISKKIKFAIKNRSDLTEELTTNADTIVRDSPYHLNQFLLQNLDKTTNGNITFYFPENTGEVEVFDMYNSLFGTNITNSEFYKTYPIDLVGEDRVVKVSETEYYYAPKREKPIVLKYRKLIDDISREPDYYITTSKNSVGSLSYYTFYLNKTPNSLFPDKEFYVHFINDKTYDFDSSGKIKETDEQMLQNYMKNYKISGTDIVFLKPYFKTYDVAATIYYNANFSETEVSTNVRKAIDNICSLEKAEIAGGMSRAKILREIMNCNGVEDCKITYFGYDFLKGINTDTIQADFYEVLCLHEDVNDQHGKILKFEIL